MTRFADRMFSSRVLILVYVTVLFVFLLILSGSAVAQVPDPAIAAQAVNPQSAHHYIGEGGETVNPADGSLAFDLKLSPATGRQLSVPFGIRYASPEHFYLSNQHRVPGYDANSVAWINFQTDGGNPTEVNGWSYDVPKLTGSSIISADYYYMIFNWNGSLAGYDPSRETRCVETNNYVFYGFEGVQRSLDISTGHPDPLHGNTNQHTCGDPGVHTTSNLHGVVATSPWPVGFYQGAPPVTVVDQAGTSYSFEAPPANPSPLPDDPPYVWREWAKTITDRNGNQIVLNSAGNGYVDTLGRTAVSWTGIGNNNDQVTIAGLPGNVALHWNSINSYHPVEGSAYTGGTPPENFFSCAGIPTSYWLDEITQIDLPNGQNYRFAYGDYGKLSQIWYPGGGYVRYTWGLNHSSSQAEFQMIVPPDPASTNLGANPQILKCYFTYSKPAVTDRWVSYDGQNEVLHQHFEYSTVLGLYPTKYTTVTNTDLVTGQSTSTFYKYAAVYPDAGTSHCQSDCTVPVEQQIMYMDDSNNVVKTINKTWLNAYSVLGEQTIIGNDLTKTTTTVRCYDNNEQVSAIYEYGFPSELNGASPPTLPSCATSTIGALYTPFIGPLKRVTTTANHQFFQGWGGSNIGLPGYDGSFLGAHIVNAPDSITVQDPSSSDPAQQTQLTYTNTTSSSGVATGHVAVTTNRANIQSVRKWSSSANAWLTSTYSWYDTGQLASQIDPCGNSTCADMNGANSNHTTSYTYTDNFAPNTGTPLAQTHAYLTGVTYPNTGTAHSESFTWGYNDGTLRTRTDQNQQTTTYKYGTLPSGCNFQDYLNRITEVDSPDGGMTTFCYNDSLFSASNNSPSLTTTKKITNSLNLVSTAAMDGMGHVVRTLTSDPEGTDITDTVYDGNGRVLKQSNPYRGTGPLYWTQYGYDALGRTLSVLKQDGSTTSSSYAWPCTTVTDEAGHARSSCNDSLGRLIEVDEPRPGATGTPGTATVTVTGSEHDGYYNEPVLTCLGSSYCWYEDNWIYVPYDSGHLTLTVNGYVAYASYGQGSTTQSVASVLASSLNASSSPVQAVVNGSAIIITAKTTGEASNYAITKNFASDYLTCCSFSATGPSALSGGNAVGDQAQVTRYAYDYHNNLTCAVQKGSDTTAFTTCAAAPAAWRPRSFTYNSLSQLLTANNPESGIINYAYDANGNVSTKTDARSINTNYTYDTLNRLTQKSYQNDPTNTAPVTYSYDAGTYGKGRRTGMSDASGQTTWSLDLTAATGWKTTEARTITGAPTKTIITQNNLDGSVASIKYPSDRVINYSYVPTGSSVSAGRPVSATDSTGPINYATGAQYAPFGGLTGLTNGSQPITVTNTYNERLQPVTLSASTSAATIMSLSYDFHRTAGDNGNVHQIVNNLNNDRSQNFEYDNLNRISKAYTSGSGATSWGESYIIDAWGNLTNRGAVAGKASYEALEVAQVPQTSVLNRLPQSSGYFYDAAGNMTQNGSAQYTYDAENRIATAGGVTYTYDGDGNRVKKSSGTLYWGAGPLAESDLSGTATTWKEYIFFGGKRIARRDASNSSVHYFFANHLGSSSVITNSTGTTIEEDLDYYPYGGIAYGAASDHYEFTGKERDTESGLDNFGARYDSSSLGRFMSADPDQESGIDNMGDPQMWNGYAYVGNNPLNRTDPSGRSVSICDSNGNYCQAVSDQEYAQAQQQDQYNHAASLDQLKQNEGSPSNITNSNGNVVGTVMYLHDENAPKEGAEKLGEKMIAGYALGSVFGKVLGAAWGAVAGWVGRGAEAGGTVAGNAAGQTAGQLGVRAGGIIDRVFQTSSGPVRVYAEVVAEGQTAVIKDVAIYPAASETGLQVGYTQMRQGMNGVLSDLKAQGFTQARIEAYRVSGAVPGRTMNLTVTLK